MSFNELLTEAGDFGLYQKLLCFGFLYSSISVVAFTYWSNVFMLFVAPHRCRLSQNDTWESDISQYHNVVVGECDLRFNGTWKEQMQDMEDISPSLQPEEESGNSTWTEIPCPHGWVYDFSVFYPTISTEQNWVCEDSWKMYIVFTWYWIGALCGYAFFGAVSDRFGRKRSYQASLLLSLIADASAIFANSHTAFSIARFFSAMGQGNIPTLAFVLGKFKYRSIHGCFVISAATGPVTVGLALFSNYWRQRVLSTYTFAIIFISVMEYTGPRKRLFILAVWSLAWTFMSAIVPVAPYLLRYWRWVLVVCTVPCGLVLLFSSFVPESASWLITRGRLDEAAKLIQRVSIVNGRKMDIQHIKEKLEKQNNKVVQFTNITDPNGLCDKKEEQEENNLTCIQALFGLIKTPNMRKKTVLLVVIWTIASTCYHGNSIEVSNLPFNLYLSYSIGAMLELPANIFCLLSLDRIGRRWANFGCLLLSGILGITGGLLKTDSRIVLILAMVMRSGFAAAFDITFTFSSESFPTEVRGRGIGVIRSFGGIGSSIAPFIVSLSEYDPLLPLVGFGILSVLAAVATLFVPETARQHLPHTLEEGERFGKEQSFFFCPFNEEIRSSGTPNNADDLGLKEDGKKDITGRDNLAMETVES